MIAITANLKFELTHSCNVRTNRQCYSFSENIGMKAESRRNENWVKFVARASLLLNPTSDAQTGCGGGFYRPTASMISLTCDRLHALTESVRSEGLVLSCCFWVRSVN